MKTKLLVLLFGLLSFTTYSQSVNWVLTDGDIANDNIQNIYFDQSGNVYTHIQQGFSSIIEKHDANGSLSWSVPVSDSAFVFKLLKTFQNDFLIVARTHDTINFQGTQVLPGIFVARLDFNGNWNNVVNTNIDFTCMTGLCIYFNDFSIDSLGQLYISETITENFTHLSEDSSHMVRKSISNAYFIKLDQNFNYLSSYSRGYDCSGFKVFADKNSNALFSINDRESLKFKLLKVDNQFDTLWVSQPSQTPSAGLEDIIEDENQNVVLAGTFYSSMTYDFLTFTNPPIYAAKPGFIIKLDPSGHVIWGKMITASALNYSNIHIEGALNNHIYISCVFADSITIGTYTLSVPDTNFALVCLDQNGDFVSEIHHEYSKPDQKDRATINENEVPYYYGSFRNSFFYNQTQSAGGFDWYMMKMSNVGIEDVDNLTGASVFPNPCNERTMIYPGKDFSIEKSHVELFDMQGRMIITDFTNHDSGVELNTTKLSDGLYELQLVNSNGKRVSERIAVMH